MICGTCRFMRFAGFSWWCKERDKKIKKWGVKCSDWQDINFKKGLK